MATVIIGSARHDENGAYTGGSAGDQLQTSTPDYSGEVSMQDFYVHSKGWYVLKPKSASIAEKLAERMKTACNNSHIGYSQSDNSKSGRYGVVNYGIDTTTNVGADCSSLVRECVKEATGKDPGDFSTDGEPSVLEASGYFEAKVKYTSGTSLETGSVLVTCSKGHTAIVVSGATPTTTGSTTTGTKTATEDATSYSASLAGTYTVTASSLNVRVGAGTTKASLGAIPKDTSCKCYGYYSTVSGVKWLYIQAQYNGTTYTGFASSEYLSVSAKKTKTATGIPTDFSATIAGTYKVSTTLYLRDDAGPANDIIGEIPEGTSVHNYGYYSVVDKVNWMYIQYTLNNTTYTGFASGKYLYK